MIDTAETVEKKPAEKIPTIAETMGEMEQEIQADRKSLAKWKRWKNNAGFAIGVSLTIGLFLGTRIPVVGLVALPAIALSTIGYFFCRTGFNNREEELNDKYTQQAKLLAAVESARSGPGSDLKLAQLAKEFSHASRISKLEKAVEELKAEIKDAFDGDDNGGKGLEKAAPSPNSSIKL